MKNNIFNRAERKNDYGGNILKLMQRDWHSLSAQGQYWTGSPWRAVRDLLR